ncbi:MAG: TonB-dependent receptor plug domain-containing protein [Myxococcota bacterium]
MSRKSVALVLALCSLAARLSGAAEFSENPDAPSAFTTTIEARAFDDRFETLEDVLDHVPGVRVRRSGGLGSFSTASIRGSKPEQVLVLLDGVRLNSSERGAVDLSTIPLRQVERIQVIRGGSAGARFGSDAAGGVISITTRRPDDDRSLDVSATTGTLATRGVDATASLGRDRLRGGLSWEHVQSRNDFRFRRDLRELRGTPFLSFGLPSPTHRRLNADFVRQSALLRGLFDTSPSSTLSATLQLQRRERGQPGNFSTAPLLGTDAQVSCPTARQRFGRAVGNLTWRHHALGPGSLELSLRHRYQRTKLRDPLRGGRNCGLIQPLLRGTTQVSSVDQQSGLEGVYRLRSGSWGPLGLGGRMTTGLQLDRLRADEVDDPSRWVYRASFLGDVQLFGGTLRLIPQLGFERAWMRPVRVLSAGTGAPISARPDSGAEWTPAIGAILRLGRDVRVKLNYGRAFRRPNFGELFFPNLGFARGNPTLRPERGISFDVGLELRRAHLGWLSELAFEGAFFHRNLRDSIEWRQLNFTFEPVNLTSTREVGFELSGAGTIFGRLELSGTFTRLDARLGSRPHRRLPHRPRNRSFGRAALRLGPTRLWVEATLETSRFLEETESLRVVGSRQLDGGITLHLASIPGLSWVPGNLRLTSEWTNWTDEQRFDSLGLPLPGRTWTLRLRGRLAPGLDR